MKNIKIFTIFLAVIMLLSVTGCNEAKQNVTSSVVSSKTADTSSQKEDVSADMPDYNGPVAIPSLVYEGEELSISEFPSIYKNEELIDTSKKYTLNGTEYTLNYVYSVKCQNKEIQHQYNAENAKLNVYFNNKNDTLVGFSWLNNEGFEYKYKAKTKEQREELTRQAVKEFLSYDVTDFVYSEYPPTEQVLYYSCSLKYYVNGKRIDKHFSVKFNTEGNLLSCLLSGGDNLEGYKDYPDFDVNKAYEAALEKFLEIMKNNAPVRYNYSKEKSQYLKIDGKYYYHILYLRDDGYELEAKEHTYVEEFNNGRLLLSVNIYVELITE